MSRQIVLTEHEQITKEEDRDILDSIGIENFSTVPDADGTLHYLGLSENYTAGYYIGACHINEETSLVILPKIEKIGYLQMLSISFRTKIATDYFSSHFKILFDEPLIECGIENDCLTPLLISSFVNSITRITTNGLKRGYVIREANLTGKIKGKICIPQNQRGNVNKGRLEKAYCRYQEYSVDIPENRLLKKALEFSRQYVTSTGSSSLVSLSTTIYRLLSFFSEVSGNDSAFNIARVKSNIVFREYNTALQLAKLILKRFDFSLCKSDMNIRSVPAYWIDMPALYEIYVYSILDEAYPGQIVFQAEGTNFTRADFVKMDEGIILDAKYKLRYQDSNSNIITDIRELSGYARDEKLLNLMACQNENYIPPCVIIYPGTENHSTLDCCKNINSQLLENNKIRGFKKFFKLGVELPNATSHLHHD